jgi:hypothetical protein
LDAIVAAFRSGGHPSVTVWSGSAGIEQLKDLDEEFFFSDPEYLAIEFAIKELEGGHSCLAVEVDNRAAAASLTETATRLGGHGFRYVGPWISERFTK